MQVFEDSIKGVDSIKRRIQFKKGSRFNQEMKSI